MSDATQNPVSEPAAAPESAAPAPALTETPTSETVNSGSAPSEPQPEVTGPPPPADPEPQPAGVLPPNEGLPPSAISYNPALSSFANGSNAGGYPHMPENMPPPPGDPYQSGPPHPGWGPPPPPAYANGYGPHHGGHDTSGPPPSSSRSAGGRGGGRQNAPGEFKIFIAGLPAHTEDADLLDCFAETGNVAGVDLKKGYGFVRFYDNASAQAAVTKYDGGSFLGSTIKVEMSHNQGGGRTTKITCFNCGAEGHYARACPLPEDLDGQRQRAHTVAQRSKERQAAKNGERPPPGSPMDMPPPMSAGMPPMPPADPYGAPPFDRGGPSSIAPYGSMDPYDRMPAGPPYYGGGRDFYTDRMAPPPGSAPYAPPPPYLRETDPARGGTPGGVPYDYRSGAPSSGGYGYSPPPGDRYGGAPGYGRDYYPPPPMDPYYRGYDYGAPPMGYGGYGADPYYGAPPARGRSPPPMAGATPVADDRRGGGYAPVPGGAPRAGRRRSLSPQARAAGYSDNASRRMDRF